MIIQTDGALRLNHFAWIVAQSFWQTAWPACGKVVQNVRG